MFLLRRILSLLPLVSLVFFSADAARWFPKTLSGASMEFSEAPEYSNSVDCPSLADDDESLVHIAMTLDPEYLRGTIAAVHSVLKHTRCPENVLFHFIAADSSSVNANRLARIVRSAFPSLSLRVHLFEERIVSGLISSSIRPALENPLNYARSYLAEILEASVKRVIYLDSDVIVVDDIQELWRMPLSGTRTVGAPEYCHTNFTKYFSDEFWLDGELSRVFDGKRPCYFNTGVMVMDLERWRGGDYTVKVEKWMRIQKERRIYELGSLPPFLLVFGGDVEAIDHRWNQHGLGGDNVENSCRNLHSGAVSLMHWSGKGKPWARLDAKNPCPVDFLWAPYDLYKFQTHSQYNSQRR